MSNEKLAPLMTYAGPAGRTRWDENGVLRTVAENEIVEEYDPRTGRYRGTRYEQEDTRLVPPISAPLSSAEGSSWFGVGADGSSGGTIRGIDFVRITETSGTSIHGVACSGALSRNGFDSFSGYIKIDNPIDRYIAVSLSRFNRNQNAETSRESACFDISTGELIYVSGGSRGITATLRNIGDGIHYFTINRSDPGDLSYSGSVSVFFTQKDASRTAVYEGDPSVSILVGAVQTSGTSLVPTSYIPGNEDSVTRARDDGRFTDPSVFNNYERGAFVVELETQSYGGSDFPQVLTVGGSSGEFLTLNVGSNSFVSNTGGVGLNTPVAGDLKAPAKFGIVWDGIQRTQSANGSAPQSKNWGLIPKSDLIFASAERGWSGWLRPTRFLENPPSAEELQRLTAVPRRTTIASGQILGDWDPNERLSLFKDRHGIKPVERDGDPVRFILDLGPAGNHLQAAPESTGLIYRTDGDRAWIEYNGVNDYFVYRAGPIVRPNVSVSAHIAFWKTEVDSTYRALVAQGVPGIDQDIEFLVKRSAVTVVLNKDVRIEKNFSLGDYTNRWNAFECVDSGGTIEVGLNGTSLGTTASPAGQFVGSGTFRLGYNKALGRYWKGPLGRITLTADADQADRDAIDAEIIDRYVSA